jgi:hypothetical protein
MVLNAPSSTTFDSRLIQNDLIVTFPMLLQTVRKLSTGLHRLIDLLARALRDRIVLARWEMLLARGLLAWALWQAIPGGTPEFSSQPYPHGLAQWIDFSWVGDKDVFGAAIVLARLGLIFYALGILAPLGLVAFLVVDVSHHTFFTSQGIQGHGSQLNALIALALLCGHVFAVFRSRSWKELLLSGSDSEQSALGWSRLMLAATYVVAGLSKIHHGGWDWWTRGESFALQILKAQDEMHFTMASPPLSASADAFGHFLETHASFADPLLLCALLMEVGAFLACTGRLPALLLGSGLVLFHLSNQWLMGLPFRGNVMMCLILFIQPLSWAVLALSQLRVLRQPARKFLEGLSTRSTAPSIWAPSVRVMLLGLMIYAVCLREDWYNVMFDEPWFWIVMSFSSLLGARTSPAPSPSVGEQMHKASLPAAARRLLTSPALLALLLGFFLLWRREWYPFSNFPMYSILPERTNALFITDLQGHLVPMKRFGFDAPTLKKLVNNELRQYKARGEIKHSSQLTHDHWVESTRNVITRMRESWTKENKRRDQGFQVHRKDYVTEDGQLITRTVLICTFQESSDGKAPLPESEQPPAGE